MNSKKAARPVSKPFGRCCKELEAYRMGKSEAYSEAARMIDDARLIPIYNSIKLAQELRVKAFDSSRPSS